MPKSSVRTCGRRSAESFRRWVNGAPVSSWTSSSNLPPTCPCACRASHVPLRSRSGRPSARQVAPTAQQADGVRGLSRRGAIRGDIVEPLWQYRGGRRSVSVRAMSRPVKQSHPVSLAAAGGSVCPSFADAPQPTAANHAIANRSQGIHRNGRNILHCK